LRCFHAADGDAENGPIPCAKVAESRSQVLAATPFNDQEYIMHSKERQQLVEFYSRDARRSLAPPERGLNKPASLLTLMLKCAACVAVVTLLMVIGNGEYHAGIDAAGRSDPAHQATVNTSSRTAADRKEVFDARRARFEGHDATPGRRIAAASVPPDSASAEGTGGATCSGGVNGGMDASGSECNEPPATAR
jgi:hypothetical protein